MFTEKANFPILQARVGSLKYYVIFRYVNTHLSIMPPFRGSTLFYFKYIKKIEKRKTYIGRLRTLFTFFRVTLK